MTTTRSDGRPAKKRPRAVGRAGVRDRRRRRAPSERHDVDADRGCFVYGVVDSGTDLVPDGLAGVDDSPVRLVAARRRGGASSARSTWSARPGAPRDLIALQRGPRRAGRGGRRRAGAVRLGAAPTRRASSRSCSAPRRATSPSCSPSWPGTVAVQPAGDLRRGRRAGRGRGRRSEIAALREHTRDLPEDAAVRRPGPARRAGRRGRWRRKRGRRCRGAARRALAPYVAASSVGGPAASTTCSTWRSWSTTTGAPSSRSTSRGWPRRCTSGSGCGCRPDRAVRLRRRRGMGLITGILGPAAGAAAGHRGGGRAGRCGRPRRSSTTRRRIRAELEEVDRQRESGELTDDEATAWEDELVERLIGSAAPAARRGDRPDGDQREPTKRSATRKTAAKKAAGKKYRERQTTAEAAPRERRARRPRGARDAAVAGGREAARQLARAHRQGGRGRHRPRAHRRRLDGPGRGARAAPDPEHHRRARASTRSPSTPTATLTGYRRLQRYVRGAPGED